MFMENKQRSKFSFNDQDDNPSSLENGPDSPISGDDTRVATTTITTNAPSPKKSRRSIQKRVVAVPIGGDGRSKGEAYPPSDSWAWRKYGQKPIKGSPYPRGYYRCSSSKGCPARKQVERSHMDPTTLIITYAYEHNHPFPTTKHQHHNVVVAAAPSNTATTPTTPSTATLSSDGPSDSSGNGGEQPSSPLVQINPFNNPTHLEFVGDSLVVGNLGVEYGWISDVSFDTPSFVGPTCDDNADVAAFVMKEEDESLFGDLDELPECSVVFQRSIRRRCTDAAPLCGSTR